MDIKEFLISDDSIKNLNQLKNKWIGSKVFDDKIYIKLQNGNNIKIEVTSKDIAHKFECFSLVIKNTNEEITFEETNIFKNGIDKITILPRYEWIDGYEGNKTFLGKNPVNQSYGKKSEIPQNIKIVCKVEECILFEKKGESLIIKCNDMPYKLNFITEEKEIKTIIELY